MAGSQVVQNADSVSPQSVQPRTQRMDDQCTQQKPTAPTPETDSSLRGQALRRATGQRPPRTLTAWEWEAWYAEHGVPASHRAPEDRQAQSRGLIGWMRSLFRRENAAARNGE